MSAARPRLAFGLLLSGGRVLLVHRAPGRADYPDTWDLPGGHIEPGEGPAAAMRREVREELGIEVTAHTELDFPPTFFPRAQTHVFAVTGWRGTPHNAAVDEHDDLGWFDADEVGGLRLGDDGFRAWLQGVLRPGPAP